MTARGSGGGRIRVAHLEAGRHLYGGALQVKYLLQGLQNLPVDSVLLCPQGSAVAGACAGLAKVVEIDMRGDLDVAQPWRLRDVLQAERVDLLHVHSRRGADVFGALAAKMCALPALLSRRVDNLEHPWLARLKYHRGYGHVVAISEAIERVLLAEGVLASRLTVIRDAVDTEVFQPLPEPAWFQATFGLAKTDFAMGVVAQLIERKGHTLLLKALPELLEVFPNLVVLLFGQGPLESDLRREVERLGLDAKVRFCGFRDDLSRVLPNLQLLVHPAYKEGLGVALLQASACGVPIVAARSGGIPEAVADGRNGLLFTAGDVGELKTALQRVISDGDLRERLSTGGRQRALQQFSIESMAAAHYRLYREFCSGRAVLADPKKEPKRVI